MLQLVYSPDRQALSAYARQQMVEAARQGQAGQVLIVPEQFSFEAERALCAAGGPSISRFGEVLSFSRLAERSLALCGGAARPVMDQGGQIMALARAVEQLRPQLKFYARSAQRSDFLLQMRTIVTELKSYRIDSAALQKASAQLEGVLAVKTQELALLLEGYEAACAQGKQDPQDRLALLCRHIMKRGFGRELRLYVEGFFGFTAMELEILSAFLWLGTDVTVLLCCDGLFEGAQVFSPLRCTARQLLQEADRRGVRVEQKALSAALPPIQGAALSAFTRRAAEDPQALRLYECPSPRQEAAALCADLLEYVRRGGRYRDIAVACCEEASLRPVLEAEFARCGIPAFFAGKQPALKTPLLSAVLSALRAACGGLEREAVLGWLKSDCAPLSQAECDRLETYVLLWDISGTLWKKPWTLHPRGLGQSWQAQDQSLLAALNEMRRRCMEPLLSLAQGLAAESTVGAYVLCLYRFLEQTEFSQRVSQQLERLAGDEAALQVTRQLYELLLHALEQLYAVYYSVERSPEEFLRLMEILLSQYRVGAIPALMDAVTVGSPSALRHKSVKQLYVCGCQDGALPQIPQGGSLLTEAERSRLRTLGLSLAPEAGEQMDRALMEAYALLCAPTERLCLSASGEQRAYLFKTLAELYPQAVSGLSPALSPAFSGAKALGLWLACREKLPPGPPEAEAYRARLLQAKAYTFGPLRAQTVLGLYGAPIRLSASRLDRYASCRFAFFLQDGLKAAQRKAAAFDAPVYGTFVHYVLEHTLRQVKAEGGFSQCSEERLLEIAQIHQKTFLETQLDPLLLESQRFSYLLQRNFLEVAEVLKVLAWELGQSRFQPQDFELRFAKDGPLPPVEIEAGAARATLSGAVDRVDLMEEGGHSFFRVVDYKTGKKDFDYTELLEGRGLQMLLYLFALQEKGPDYYGKPIHPAGVLYVPARDEILYLSQRPEQGSGEAERRKAHRRQGLLLHDPLLLQAMEPCGADSPQLLPYKMRRDGPSGDLMDLSQLSLLKRYVNHALQDMTRAIYGGEVSPNPYVRGSFGACSFCPYASVCHLDLGCGELHSLKATSAKEFWERLAQKEAKHG